MGTEPFDAHELSEGHELSDGHDRDPLFELITTVIGHRVEVGPLIRATAHAALYAGRDRRRGVEVVLKVCGPGASATMQAEARALARLGGHPHILGAVLIGHGAGDAGLRWIVTDRASGGSLDRRIGAPADVVLRWASQLADALTYAHANGVVHGDVTPSNVFLDGHDLVLLGDFGSAIVLDDAPAAEHPTGYTPAYAAPERRRRAPATPADDVYGLAATMMTVCGDHHGLPTAQRRMLQRCLGPPGARPDAQTLAHRLER